MNERDKSKRIKPLLKKLSFWPPFLGAGIRVTRVAEDFRTVEVELRMRFFNRNYAGTHFGGSLYSMCDPWFMLMLIEHLGPDYIGLGQGCHHPLQEAGQRRGQGKLSYS